MHRNTARTPNPKSEGLNPRPGPKTLKPETLNQLTKKCIKKLWDAYFVVAVIIGLGLQWLPIWPQGFEVLGFEFGVWCVGLGSKKIERV